MVESIAQSNKEKNYIQKSKLPSIGSFITLLEYFQARKLNKPFLKCLFRNGGDFYKRHVKHSNEFSDRYFFTSKMAEVINLDFNDKVALNNLMKVTQP